MPVKPIMTVIAGPNGSGKTVLFRALVAQGYDPGLHINADDIALTLPATKERDFIAQGKAQELRDRCLAEGTSFTFETVMSHPSKIEEMIAARAQGFIVRLIFVAVDDPTINLARVALRVREGGHNVPADKIVSRYERTMSLLPRAILAADNSVIFDNSDFDVGHVLVASCDAAVAGDVRSLSVKEVRHTAWFAKALHDANGLYALCRGHGVLLEHQTPTIS